MGRWAAAAAVCGEPAGHTTFYVLVRVVGVGGGAAGAAAASFLGRIGATILEAVYAQSCVIDPLPLPLHLPYNFRYLVGVLSAALGPAV